MFAMILSVLNYNYFDNYMAARLYKLASETKSSKDSDGTEYIKTPSGEKYTFQRGMAHFKGCSISVSAN